MTARTPTAAELLAAEMSSETPDDETIEKVLDLFESLSDALKTPERAAARKAEKEKGRKR